MDLNHRSPASKAGRDDQAPLHADASGIDSDRPGCSNGEPVNRSVNLTRKNGAHGRTRTCTFLIRNQGLYPVELRVRCWRRDGDLNSDCSVENRVSWPLRRSRRTWLPDQDSNLDLPGNNRGSYRWMIGEEFGGAPRARSEL